jgi:hypothetical protein
MFAYFRIFIRDNPVAYGIITVKTSRLIPILPPIINPKHATYRSTKFTIVKIELFINQTLIQTVSEIEGSLEIYSSYQRFEIKQTISNSRPSIYLYKSKNFMINGRSYLFQINNTMKNGWYSSYGLNGRLFSSFFYINNVIKKTVNVYLVGSDIVKLIYVKQKKTIYIIKKADGTIINRYLFDGFIDFHKNRHNNISYIIQYKRNREHGAKKYYNSSGRLYFKCFLKNSKIHGLFWNLQQPELYISGRFMGPYKMKLPWDIILGKPPQRIVIF